MQTFTATALSLAVLAVALLTAGGMRLILRRTNRKQGILMLAAAAVLLVNVLIWTL